MFFMAHGVGMGAGGVVVAVVRYKPIFRPRRR